MLLMSIKRYLFIRVIQNSDKHTIKLLHLKLECFIAFYYVLGFTVLLVLNDSPGKNDQADDC